MKAGIVHKFEINKVEFWYDFNIYDTSLLYRSVYDQRVYLSVNFSTSETRNKGKW